MDITNGEHVANPKSTYFIRSARVGFRTWTFDDFPYAVSLWGDPEVTKYLDAREQWNEEQVRERLLKEISTNESHGVQYWPMFTLAGGDFVGCCGLRPTTKKGEGLELGAHLRKAYWGQGYAMEISRTVIEYAFGTLAQSKLVAGHHPDNAASRRIFQKLGFQYTHDEYYPPCGLHGPCYVLTPETYVA